MEHPDPAEVRERLELLRIERELALTIGLDADEAYMDDLERQCEAWEAALVVCAVTELAVRQAALRGPLHG